MAPTKTVAKGSGRQSKVFTKSKTKAAVKAHGKAKAKAKLTATKGGKAPVSETRISKGAAAVNAKASSEEICIAEAFMRSAAASALGGIRLEHGGPFGATIVRDGVIISCAHNMVLKCGDPSKHAEMNAIQQACMAIGSHDLSDCVLYTTCEPCPMCWGAVQWSRLGKVHIGVDRHTAAKYGFDDKVFYDEVDEKSGCYGLRRCGYIPDTSKTLKVEKKRTTKNMVEVYDGILHDDVQGLFMDPRVNRTALRRFGSMDGKILQNSLKEVFAREPGSKSNPMADKKNSKQHEEFMRAAIKAAERGAHGGRSKEREPFGAVIVKDGKVIAGSHNSVLESRDATATAEVNAIRAAAAALGTHSLEGCDMYCTAHPDLMSLGAILWARISRVFCGVTQQVAAQHGFEEGIAHFKDLLAGRRVTQVVEGIAKAECEAVFQEWSHRNGVIY